MPNDRNALVERVYADDTRLMRRISIYQWQQPPLDLPGFALAHLGQVDGPVLDVGWGAGTYTDRLRAERPDLRVVPLDLSAGLRPEVIADVMALPIRSGAAGAALAMHMLYHAADPAAALAELRRVLRPGGRLLVSTNASDDKRELAFLWRDALIDLGTDEPPPYPDSDGPFELNDAVDLVQDVFGSCTVSDHRSVLVVPEADPVIAYVDSCSVAQEPGLPDGVDWADYRRAVGERVRAEVERHGSFRINAHVGVLIASAP